MAGRSGDSQYFEVKGRGKKPYKVTINYDTGHFCTCRGILAKKKIYGEDTGRTEGTSCKHIIKIINEEFGGDWGTKVKGGGGRRTPATQTAPSSTPPATPAQPTGRRAAIMAQRAKRERETTGRRAAHAAQQRAKAEAGAATVRSDLPLLDRIAALEAAREGATS